jgi:hypothetical protein
MNSSFVYRNISLLYRSLEEIQKNMGFVARRGNAFLDNRRVNSTDRVYTINADQRFMIETYKEMYNTILQHIEFLYSQLLHVPQQYNANLQNQNQNQNQRPSNLFYFNGHYYTIDQTTPVNINAATPLEQHTHVPTYNIPAPTHRSAGSAIPPPPRAPTQRTARAPRTFPRAIISRAMGNFNDPVNVVATPRQISTATTQLLYENIDTPTNDRCPICLEVFQPDSEVTQINHCRHVFNRTELATWFETNVRCPVCRFDIRDHVNGLPLPATSSTNTAPLNTNIPTPTPTPTPPAPPLADSDSDGASMSTLNNHLTDILDNLTNQAFQNMFQDNATSQILTNLFNNNIENLTYDASANAFTFDTFIQDRR